MNGRGDEERPQVAASMGFLVVAAVLFAGALTIPYLPGRDPDSALAKRYDLDNRTRGDVVFEVDLLRGGEILPSDGAGPRRVGDRLAFRYDGGGFLYLWILEVGPGGALTPVAVDQPRGYHGHRAQPHGGVLTTTASASAAGPAVFYVLFAPVPTTLTELHAAAKAAAAQNRDPEAIARAIQRPGRSLVRVLR